MENNFLHLRFYVLFMALMGYLSSAMAVNDTIPPVIDLHTDGTICHKLGTPYKAVQPTATDNYYSSSQISLTLISSDVDPNVPGIYQEVYEAIDGSGNKSRKTRFVKVSSDCNTATVHSLKESVVYVYPNPADNQLKIDLNGNVGILTIVSMDGRQVLQAPVNGNTDVNISQWSAGVYSVQVRIQDDVRVLKLVIRH